MFIIVNSAMSVFFYTKRIIIYVVELIEKLTLSKEKLIKYWKDFMHSSL